MYRIVLLAFSLLVSARVLTAQISPGDLSESHKDLEGIGNCTTCHTMGRSLSNANCLTCHAEIKNRMDAGKGFHAPLRSKECVECHKEHHGRNFRLIRFEREQFDHSTVGFRLEGKHASLSCEQCHKKERIIAKDILSLSDERKNHTLLGLGTQCISCHKDEHLGQFKAECVQCHGMNRWKPAVKFSHDKARFSLEGAHAKVECAICHPKELGHGTVTKFVSIEYASCRSCHTDPHQGKFKQECSSCHTMEAWRSVKPSSFDHNVTRFPLKGKHASMKCEQCHPKNAKTLNPSGSPGFHIVKFQQCRDCHTDAHAKQFDGRKDHGNCNACHTENGFTGSTYTLADHRSSRFPLLGAHAAVPCIKCHQDGKVSAKSTKQFHWDQELDCTVCHQYVHKGEFRGKMPNGCETCHSTEAWDVLKFSHEKTAFPLKGKHADVSCAKCHSAKDGTKKYTGLPKECSGCHEDRHAEQFVGANGTACERCHTEKDWKALLFDHNSQSRFPLTGKHENVRCGKCHKQTLIRNKRTIKYKPLEAACVDCHPAQ